MTPDQRCEGAFEHWLANTPISCTEREEDIAHEAFCSGWEAALPALTAVTAAQAFAEMASIYLGEAADDTFDAQHRAARASTARNFLKAALARLDDPLSPRKATR